MKVEELVAGPETDRRVAEAVGCYEESYEHHGATLYKLVVPGGVDRIDFVEQGACWSDSPKSSSDLNDAFWAAEQVGLFRKPYEAELHGDGKNSWIIYWLSNADPDIPVLQEVSTTAALAICAVILELKK